jgi:hypothetical protein
MCYVEFLHGIIHHLTNCAILPSTKIHLWELVCTYENLCRISMELKEQVVIVKEHIK